MRFDHASSARGGCSSSSASTALSVPSRSDVDLLERPLEGTPAGADEVVVVAPHRAQRPVELVHLLDEHPPLLLERAEQRQDLVRRVHELQVLDRLAHQCQHREQREGRAQHDSALSGLVAELGVVLVDERVELLVGDEQQHEVDGAGRGVDVVAPGEGPHVAADVTEEVVAEPLAVEVGDRLGAADVVLERELHVHVHAQAVGQQEREVGDPPAARDRGLLAVVDALDQAREPEHVLGHALTPLARAPSSWRGPPAGSARSGRAR